MIKEKREIKLGLFADLFGDDEKDGKRKTDSECVMKLSDAFLEQQKDPQCELKVKFTKIRDNEHVYW